jgi:hypothetical protein
MDLIGPHPKEHCEGASYEFSGMCARDACKNWLPPWSPLVVYNNKPSLLQNVQSPQVGHNHDGLENTGNMLGVHASRLVLRSVLEKRRLSAMLWEGMCQEIDDAPKVRTCL